MQAVFFDLDGTLVELPDDFAGIFEETLRDHDVQPDSDHHECYGEAFFEYLGDCHPEPYRSAMADLREAFDLEPTAEALAETYTERETSATALQQGVGETLEALATSSDTTLGVLTNGAGRSQHRKLAHYDIAHQFDAVVISGEVGAGKPDPEIFAAAKDAIPADEYVFVADDLERDVLPAQEAGFTGIYLTGDTQENTADTEHPADESIRSLGEVPELLD